MDTRRGIQSIEIGFRVLQCLEAAGEPLSLTEIAQATAMSPSRAQFYLVSLQRVGVVAQAAPGGRYCLGPAAIRLGVAAMAQMDVLEAARAKMIELREETGDTVYVSVWGSLGPTIVNRLDGRRIAPLAVRVGAVMPLLSSATGKTFLTYLPRSVTADVLRREAASLRRDRQARATARDIERIVAEVRAHGLSRTRGGVTKGLVALAAPILDYEGTLHCVLTLMGYDGVLKVDYRSDAARMLRKAAHEISLACGYSEDGARLAAE